MTFSSKVFQSLMVVALIVIAVPAMAAGDLTAKTAKQFVDSLPDINAMAEEMRANGKADILNAKTQPVPGEKFEPYTKAVSALKGEFPDDYKKLNGITKSNGFSSPEAWADTGDDVMMAYMATQVNMPAGAAMPNISPEMMAKMPPEAVAKMKQSMAVMETISSVPQAHKDIVTPLIPSINMFIGSEMSEKTSQ